MEPILTVPFTAEHYGRLPEGFPAELVEGTFAKLPPPSPDHEAIVRRVAERFSAAAGERRVPPARAEVWVDDLNVLRPDVALLDEADDTPDSSGPAIPRLVVEVLAPPTADRDRDLKSPIYLRAGVTEVWLVDPDERSIEIRTTAGTRAINAAGTATTTLVPGLDIRGTELFA